MENQRLSHLFNFVLSKAFSTSFVSVISSFSTSILIVRFNIFSSFCHSHEIQFDCLFHLKSFLKDFSKGLQLFLSCNHTKIVTMTQSFEISITTAEESWARGLCLSRLTLRHAFRTCFCKVWPTCQLASFTIEMRSRRVPRGHFEWTVNVISIVVSCHHC